MLQNKFNNNSYRAIALESMVVVGDISQGD